MSSISQIYVNTIAQNLKPYHANWEPSSPVKLGDYGYLKDHIFVQVGNLADLSINFTIRVNQDDSQKTFTSNNDLEIKFNPRIQSIEQLADASVEINFSKKGTVYFNILGCTTEFIENKNEVGRKIATLFFGEKWNIDFVVITELIRADKSLIVVSARDNSSIKFELSETNASVIDLSDVGLDLKIAYQKSIGFIVNCKRNLIPLFAFSKLQSKFPWNPKDFKAYWANQRNETLERLLEEASRSYEFASVAQK